MPIRYLLSRHTNIEVLQFDETSPRPTPREMLAAEAYVVTFAGSEVDVAIQSTSPETLKRWQIVDYGGRPVIDVWRSASHP